VLNDMTTYGEPEMIWGIEETHEIPSRDSWSVGLLNATQEC
jgi:hypothetical protein